MQLSGIGAGGDLNKYRSEDIKGAPSWPVDESNQQFCVVVGHIVLSRHGT